MWPTVKLNKFLNVSFQNNETYYSIIRCSRKLFLLFLLDTYYLFREIKKNAIHWCFIDILSFLKRRKGYLFIKFFEYS